jgi:pSer/pThr/pTyr-binding forkhead associated (FHA) protein
MEAKLVVRTGKRPGQEVPVRGPTFLIGREEGCHLRPQSPEVGPRHCEILVGEALLAVRDLGSQAGTFVNGQRVAGQRELRGGDLLRIGPLLFEVKIDIRIGGPKRPKVRSVQEAAARSAQVLPHRNEDLDISEWLDEEEVKDAAPPVAAQSASPTAAGSAATSERKPPVEGDPGGSRAAVQGSPPSTPAADGGRKAPQPGPGGGKGRFAKKKPSTQSSGDAAAEILRRLSQRKP